MGATQVDLAGNVRRLRDSSGADLGGYRYTAFGVGFPADAQAPAPAVAQPLQWKGRWYEPVAGGVYEMRARWWSPRMGAFAQIDAFNYAAGTNSLWGWPRENPIAWSDSTGHDRVNASVGLFSPQDTEDSYAAGAYFAEQTSNDYEAGKYGSAAWNGLLTIATGLGGAVTQVLQKRAPTGVDLALAMCPVDAAAEGAAEGIAAEITIDPNKLNHIFGDPGHNLAPLVEGLGSQQAAFQAIQSATQAAADAQAISGVLRNDCQCGRF